MIATAVPCRTESDSDVPATDLPTTGLPTTGTNATTDTDANAAAALLAGALAGEQGAWAELVRLHDRYLHHVARTFVGPDCDDLVQAAWLRLLERGDTIRDPRAVRAWLARVIQNEAKIVYRRRSRENTSSLDDAWADSIPSGEPTPETQAVAGATTQLVRQALHALPARQHKVMMLCAYADADYQQISTVLSMPVGSIGPTRGRALDRMRHTLVAQGVDASMRMAS